MLATLLKRWSIAFALVLFACQASAQPPSRERLQPAPLQDLSVPQPEPEFAPPAAQPPVVQTPPPVAPPTFAPSPVAPVPPPVRAAPVDPGATLPPQLRNVPAQTFGNLSSTFGATAGSFSAAPTLMGDFFGGGFSAFSGTQTVTFRLTGPGFILNGSPGASNSTLAYEFGNDIVPNDIFTTGLGNDASGDGNADTFSILEPVPPTDAPTAPGPGFVFSGGTAVFIGNVPGTTAQDGIYTDGDNWFVSYSYAGDTASPGPDGRIVPVPGPGVSVRRVKLSENFSPEVRDRCFFNYNFFNDAYAGLGDISRFTFGIEKVLKPKLVSLEFRLPTAGTYGSTQRLGSRESRDYEVGNPALVAKGVLLRDRPYIWTGGLGVAFPIADDTRLQTSAGQNLLVVQNRAWHLLPFTALMIRHNRDTVFQTYLQLDVAANGDPIFGNLAGGVLPRIGVFNDSTLLHADFAINKTIYRNRCGDCLARSALER